MKQIGIYPGTFDPIHEGHIAFALKSIEVCGLDEVVFLPETHPRGKSNVSAINARLDQINQAISDYQNLSVTLITSSPFTIEQTLPELQTLFPGSNLTLLVGSDVYAAMNEWPGLPQLLSSATIAVGLRHNANIPTNLEEDSVVFIDLPDTAHLSSRNARSR